MLGRFELGEDNQRQPWVEPAITHGFVALTDLVECLDKTTHAWSRRDERTLQRSGTAIGIEWNLAVAVPIISARDTAPGLLGSEQVYL